MGAAVPWPHVIVVVGPCGAELRGHRATPTEEAKFQANPIRLGTSSRTGLVIQPINPTTFPQPFPSDATLLRITLHVVAATLSALRCCGNNFLDMTLLRQQVRPPSVAFQRADQRQSVTRPGSQGCLKACFLQAPLFPERWVSVNEHASCCNEMFGETRPVLKASAPQSFQGHVILRFWRSRDQVSVKEHASFCHEVSRVVRSPGPPTVGALGRATLTLQTH